MTSPARIVATLAALGAACAAACGPGSTRARSAPPAPKGAKASPPRSRWLVVAPHPDDEALIAGGVLARATEDGEPAFVVVMTNGDFECRTDRLVRERESLAGLAALGVPESRVRFLGYPDGSLGSLGRRPLSRPRLVAGACVTGDRTREDVLYTRPNAVGDLARLLEALHPTDVAITHPMDTHPDHAATYAIFREALDRVSDAPRVHRAIVHAGDCWPTGPEPREPCPPAAIAPDRPMPPLTNALAGYEPRERIAVPASCRSPDPAKNPKLRAIGAHRSQTRGTLESYLFAFARSDEAFFPETFERHGSAWVRTGTVPMEAMASSEVGLRPDERHAIDASPPLAVSARIARGLVRLGLVEDAAGGYDVEIDGTKLEARAVRRSTGAAPVVLQTWPLPHDLWADAAEEAFEIRIDPRPEDGGVAELSLFCRGALTGVAVDVHPRARGEWMSASAPVSVRISAFPSARRAP